MFAYALAEGIANGWLDDAQKARAAVEKAWTALVGKMDGYGNIADVCAGTGWKNSREHYLGRPRVNGDPHAQAPMLWLCNALMQ